MYNTMTMIEKKEQTRLKRDHELAKIKMFNNFRNTKPFPGRLMKLAYNVITESYYYIQADLDAGKISYDDLYTVTDYINSVDPLVLDENWESMLN
jgi:hypothetical protein